MGGRQKHLRNINNGAEKKWSRQTRHKKVWDFRGRYMEKKTSKERIGNYK